jgi:hypothetical protein
MIRIDRERYLKHMVIDLEAPNKSSSTNFSLLGNYSCESYFRNFAPLLSNVLPTQNSELIFQDKLLILIGGTLFYKNSTLDLVKQEVRKKETNKGNENSASYS